MRNKAEKKATFRQKLLGIALVSLFLILIIVSFFGKNGLLEMQHSKKKYSALIHQIEQLKSQKKKLEKEIKAYKANPQAIEKKAREKLWLMLPDEIVIIKKEK